MIKYQVAIRNKHDLAFLQREEYLVYKAFCGLFHSLTFISNRKMITPHLVSQYLIGIWHGF